MFGTREDLLQIVQLHSRTCQTISRQHFTWNMEWFGSLNLYWVELKVLVRSQLNYFCNSSNLNSQTPVNLNVINYNYHLSQAG